MAAAPLASSDQPPADPLPTRPPVRLAVLGAGLIGRRHAQAIRSVPPAALAAIVDPAPEAAALAQTLGVPWFADFAAMLARQRPDGVIIATPNVLHVPMGLQAVAAGLPALIEKPLADDLVEGAKLVAAAKAAGVPLATGHHRRHNPLIHRAKALLADGALGRIVAVHGTFWLKKPDPYFDVAWRRAPGAGPVLLNLIHDVDLLRHLCGAVVEVQAMVSNAVRGFAVEDTMVATLRLASGALATLTCSDTVVAPWSWEHTAGENPVYPHTDQICMFIGGTRGSLAIPRLELWRNEAGDGWLEPFATTRPTVAAADPLLAQIAQFVRVVRGEDPPLVSGEDGLETLRVIDAIGRAARSGARETVS